MRHTGSSMEWAAHYIGLPYKDRGRSRDGLDCWGLVALVLAEQFGVSVPDFSADYTSAEDAADVGRLVRGERGKWWEVPLGMEKPGDVVLFRILGHPCHTGVVIGGNKMLHCFRGWNSVLDDYTRLRWRDRIEGFYRHEALCS